MTKATLSLAKVGGAYIGAAVLALEAYNALTAPLDLPSWIFWLVVVAVGSGLPLALLIAIRFIRQDPDIETDAWMTWAPRALAVATVAVVLGGGGAVTYWVAFAEGGVRAREAELGGPSVAVMPFENQSPDPADGYFAEGLTHELTRVFTEVPGVRVMAARAATESKADGPVAPLELGRELGARTVLEGAVSKSGDRIRVTARLIDTTDGVYLWSDKYDRELMDVFDLQDELSAAIVRELSPTVAQSKATPDFDWGTESTEAYLDYLRGRSLLERGTATDSAAAVEALRQAVDRDPHFAVAREVLEGFGG
jgi:TolB-like protein